MFTKEIKYKDFLGNDQVEKFRFNISENEMIDMVDKDPTFSLDYLMYLSKEPNGLKMLDVARKLIVLSYGQLSEDGKKFRKSDELALEFVQSAAFNALLDEFIEGKDPQMIKDFMLGIFPAKYAEKIKKGDVDVTAIPGTAGPTLVN